MSTRQGEAQLRAGADGKLWQRRNHPSATQSTSEYPPRCNSVRQWPRDAVAKYRRAAPAMAAPRCKEVQEHIAVGSAVNELGPVRELEVLDEECRIVLVIVGADGQGRVLHACTAVLGKAGKMRSSRYAAQIAACCVVCWARHKHPTLRICDIADPRCSPAMLTPGCTAHA